LGDDDGIGNNVGGDGTGSDGVNVVASMTAAAILSPAPPPAAVGVGVVGIPTIAANSATLPAAVALATAVANTDSALPPIGVIGLGMGSAAVGMDERLTSKSSGYDMSDTVVVAIGGGVTFDVVEVILLFFMERGLLRGKDGDDIAVVVAAVGDSSVMVDKSNKRESNATLSLSIGRSRRR
jgi:hypothetical protein